MKFNTGGLEFVQIPNIKQGATVIVILAPLKVFINLNHGQTSTKGDGQHRIKTSNQNPSYKSNSSINGLQDYKVTCADVQQIILGIL